MATSWCKGAGTPNIFYHGHMLFYRLLTQNSKVQKLEQDFEYYTPSGGCIILHYNADGGTKEFPAKKTALYRDLHYFGVSEVSFWEPMIIVILEYQIRYDLI